MSSVNKEPGDAQEVSLLDPNLGPRVMLPVADETPGQLQFDLAGIPRLTRADQLEQWISHGEDPFSQRAVEASFLACDAETLSGRVLRRLWVHDMETSAQNSWGWLIPGGSEGLWLYNDAASAYVNGEYLAVVVCSHAAAERTLAARLNTRNELKGLERAGLGPLVVKAYNLGIISSEAQRILLRLNDIRKPIAHLKDPLDQDGISYRMYVRPETAEYAEGLDSLLREDAELALRCADFALRGMGSGPD